MLHRRVFDDTSSSPTSSLSLLSSMVSSRVAPAVALPFVFARVVFFAFCSCCFFSFFFFFFWVFFAAFFSRHGGLDPASLARFLAMLRYFCGIEPDGGGGGGGNRCGSEW